MTVRVIIGVGLLACSAIAAAQQFQPATFDHPEKKRRLLDRIEWPDVKGDIEVILSCFSQIRANGKMTETGCYLRTNYDEPFVFAVNDAAKKSRMTPAIVGGRPQQVYVQFQVKFVAKYDEREIAFILNPGYEENVKAYGFGHIGGQRVFAKNEPWYDACPKRAHYAVWVRAYLGEDGIADSPSVDHVDGIMPTPTCQDAIKRTILQSRFTPAMSDGMPVPSTYIEAFTN